jgi:hypothetical protein
MMTRSAIKSPLTRYQGVDTKLRTPGSPRPPNRLLGVGNSSRASRSSTRLRGSDSIDRTLGIAP